MTATDGIERFPEEGENIITTVRQVSGHGVYVTLDEYNTMTCFLHISPIATGWIRNIKCYVRPEQASTYSWVNKVRRDVDPSLKWVSGEERKSRLIEVEKSVQANIFLDFIKSKLSLPDQQSRNRGGDTPKV